MAGETLDTVDRTLLEELQRRFPLDHRPFEVLGEKLGTSEQDCLQRIIRLKAHGTIRRIGGLFDAAALGYHEALLALRVPTSRLDEAAALLGQYPGVSSVQARNDPFNLWAAIAVPPTDGLEQVARTLEALLKGEEAIALPVLRVYKAGADPDLSGLDTLVESGHPSTAQTLPRPVLSDGDLRCIRLLQDDLPLLELPFAVWAEHVELTEDELFSWIKRMEHVGILRRMAAVLPPRRTSRSIMTTLVWQVPSERVDAVGARMALIREVSYCCRRPIGSSWPYPLFTGIQTDTETGWMAVVQRIQEQVGSFPHKHFFSVKDYKKSRVLYFDPALETWWREVGSRAEV